MPQYVVHSLYSLLNEKIKGRKSIRLHQHLLGYRDYVVQHMYIFVSETIVQRNFIQIITMAINLFPYSYRKELFFSETLQTAPLYAPLYVHVLLYCTVCNLNH